MKSYKILAEFIKDISSETKDIQTYLFVKDYISKYQLTIDINSQPSKNKLIEVSTFLKFEDKENNEKKSFFELVYVTIVKLDDGVKEKKLIIHNAEFDMAHLNNELSLIGKYKIDKKNIIDTLDLARDKFPGSQINLDALCKRFRIDNSRRDKHTALLDCELLSKVYINLIDQKEPTLDFKSLEKVKADIDTNNLLYCKKIIYPTKEETKSHKEYLKSKVSKNFF